MSDTRQSHSRRLLVAVAAAAWLAALPAAAQSAPTKKELVAKALQLQMPGIEAMAQALVERPAALLMQEAGQALQQRIAVDQREAVSKRIQDSAKKYVDEAAPLIRARAIKLAPSVLGAEMEARFSEAELAQLVAWLESPVSRKYQQTMPEIQDSFVQKLIAEARPQVDPKLNALEQDIRSALSLPPPGAAKKAPTKPSTGDNPPKSK